MGVWKKKDHLNWKEGFKRWLYVSGLSIFVLIWMVGCSSSSSDKASSSEGMASAVQMSSSDMMVQNQAGASKEKQEIAPAANAANANSVQPNKGSAVPSSVPLTVTPAIGAEGTDGFNRKLIYKANLVMPVEDYTVAQTQLRDLVALSGAYILQFSENANTGERGGSFTIKVAASGFVSLLDGLEKISPSLQRSVQGQDVTEEYVDLESRLKSKQAVEARLLDFMGKAAKTDELLAFSNELAKVQEEIEKIKGRMRYLDQNVSYSTIELRMYQLTGSKALAQKGEPSLGSRLKQALDGSLNVLVTVLQGILIALAAALPIIILVLLASIPFIYYRRKRSQRLADVRAQMKQQQSLVQSPAEPVIEGPNPDVNKKDTN
jgi:hypothetical protein